MATRDTETIDTALVQASTAEAHMFTVLDMMFHTHMATEPSPQLTSSEVTEQAA